MCQSAEKTRFRGLIMKHDRHAQGRTSLLTWLSIMGTGWHVRYAWSCVVCLHRELVILLTSLCRAHRVALFNRTGLRVIVTQEFFENWLCTNDRGILLRCVISNRCEGQSRVTGDHVISSSAQQGNGRHVVEEALKAHAEWFEEPPL